MLPQYERKRLSLIGTIGIYFAVFSENESTRLATQQMNGSPQAEDLTWRNQRFPLTESHSGLCTLEKQRVDPLAACDALKL